MNQCAINALVVFSISSRTIVSSFSPSAKAADRIVKFSAIDPDGNKREVVGLSGQTLLKALTNQGLIDPDSHPLEEIDTCSAECEVHIAQEWLEKLPPPSYDEQYVLMWNSRNRVLNKHWRLGCQVVLSPDLQGMVVAVPEPKPRDIPFSVNPDINYCGQLYEGQRDMLYSQTFNSDRVAFAADEIKDAKQTRPMGKSSRLVSWSLFCNVIGSCCLPP